VQISSTQDTSPSTISSTLHIQLGSSLSHQQHIPPCIQTVFGISKGSPMRQCPSRPPAVEDEHDRIGIERNQQGRKGHGAYGVDTEKRKAAKRTCVLAVWLCLLLPDAAAATMRSDAEVILASSSQRGPANVWGRGEAGQRGWSGLRWHRRQG
jgi:hypothetical protein